MDSVVCARVILFLMSVGALSVHGVDLGESCSTGNDCTTHSLIQCEGGKCACVSGHVQNHTIEYKKEECVTAVAKTKNHGESCAWGECKDDFVCKNEKCACPFYQPAYNMETKACEKSGRDEPCVSCVGTVTTGSCSIGRDSEGLLWTSSDSGCNGGSSNLDCSNDKCGCMRGFNNYHVASKRCEGGYPGNDCIIDRDCEGGNLKIQICQNGKCACNQSLPMWDMDARTCRKPMHGENCKEDTTCGDGMKCGSGGCECGQGSTLDTPTKTCKKTVVARAGMQIQSGKILIIVTVIFTALQ